MATILKQKAGLSLLSRMAALGSMKRNMKREDEGLRREDRALFQELHGGEGIQPQPTDEPMDIMATGDVSITHNHGGGGTTPSRPPKKFGWKTLVGAVVLAALAGSAAPWAAPFVSRLVKPNHVDDTTEGQPVSPELDPLRFDKWDMKKWPGPGEGDVTWGVLNIGTSRQHCPRGASVSHVSFAIAETATPLSSASRTVTGRKRAIGTGQSG